MCNLFPFENNKFLRWVMKSYKIPLLLILLLFMINGVSHADYIIDSVGYKIKLDGFSALPGTIGYLPVKTKNITDIGAFLIRITYDTTMLTPVTIPGSASGNIVYDSLLMVGRGLSTILTKNPGSPDEATLYSVYSARDTSDHIINRDAIIIQFLPPYDTSFGQPVIATDTNTTTILNFLFYVNSSLTTGQSSWIYVRNYTGAGTEYRENQFSSLDGVTTIYPGPGPTFGYGKFTVGTPTIVCPDGYHVCGDSCCLDAVTNNAPTVTVPASSYSVEQGETVTFTVSSVDADGDADTLRALSLPTNATFTPSNPVVGTGSVSGVFSFTPSYSQSGTFGVSFQATDDNGSKSAIVSVSIIVAEVLVDRLFSTSAYDGSPVGGIPGATPVIFPIDLVSTHAAVYGVQFDMSYPSDMATIDSILVTTRDPEYVVYQNLGQYPDTVRVVTFGLANEAIGAADDISGAAILNAYMTIDSNATPGDYWINFYNAWESVDPDPDQPSLTLMTDSAIVQVDRHGDVNLDTTVNVADLVNVVAYIIGNYGLRARNFAAADVVKDDVVNVVDLIGIVNIIFGLPMHPSTAPTDYGDSYATMKIVYDSLTAGQLTKLSVQGDFPDDVAGVQLQIDYDPNSIELSRPELAEAASEFMLAYNNDEAGRLRMVLYSRQPWKTETLIPSGLADIILLPATVKSDIKSDDESKIHISQVYLANANAYEIPVEGPAPVVPTTFMLYQNYPNPFNPTTRIDFDINNSDGGTGVEQARLKIYNILGQHIRTLVDKDMAPGHYSISWDATDNSGRSVATGIYLYRLEVGAKFQTKKMLLLK